MRILARGSKGGDDFIRAYKESSKIYKKAAR
jgi:hypothetical protein